MKVYALLIHGYDYTDLLGIYATPEGALTEARRVNRNQGRTGELKLKLSDYSRFSWDIVTVARENSTWMVAEEHEVETPSGLK